MAEFVCLCEVTLAKLKTAGHGDACSCFLGDSLWVPRRATEHSLPEVLDSGYTYAQFSIFVGFHNADGDLLLLITLDNQGLQLKCYCSS